MTPKEKTERPWFVVRIDGKVAAISTDCRLFAQIAAKLASGCGKAGQGTCFSEVSCSRTGFDEIWELRKTLTWDDLILFGTPFQKKVWRRLFWLTHGEMLPEVTDGREEEASGKAPHGRARLICYSDFAGLCQNRAGVRAVAHAIGLNPVSVVIPCHLVIPKEASDRINEILKNAEVTLFKGDDLCFVDHIDFGNYALGPELKRELIIREFSE